MLHPMSKCNVKAYLEHGDGCPQDVVEVFPVALAARVSRHYFRAGALPLVSAIVHKLAKLTPKQVHAEDAAAGRGWWGGKLNEYMLALMLYC